MRALFFLLNTINCVLSSACDNHRCILISLDDNSEISGICEEDSSQKHGYKCKCEELGTNYHLTDWNECYFINGNGDGIVLDTEPTTTTVTAEPFTTNNFDTTVSPSLLPPEEITDEETSTITSRPSITAAQTDPLTTTIATTTEKEERELLFGMEPIIFFILIGGCGLFVIIIVSVSIIYCRCPSKKKETPARHDTQRHVLLPDVDEEENFPLSNSNRAETNWKDSQDSFDNSEDEWIDQSSPTEAIKLCKYKTQPVSATQSQNGGSRPISCSMHSISSTRPSLKPPAPPVPDPSALLNAPPDFPPPPPPPAAESSGNMIANPKYPYHVPLAKQQQP